MEAQTYEVVGPHIAAFAKKTKGLKKYTPFIYCLLLEMYTVAITTVRENVYFIT